MIVALIVYQPSSSFNRHLRAECLKYVPLCSFLARSVYGVTVHLKSVGVWGGIAARDLEDYLQCQVSQFSTTVVQLFTRRGSEWLAETRRALPR